MGNTMGVYTRYIIKFNTHETPSLLAAIEMLSGSQISNCHWQGLGSDPDVFLQQIAKVLQYASGTMENHN